MDDTTRRADLRTEQYWAQPAATDPAVPGKDQARVAHWLNADHHYPLKLIIDCSPIRRITKISTGGILLGSLQRTPA